MRATQHPPTRRTLDVELLAIDLTSCTRCTGTLASVEAAIAEVRRVGAATGTEVRLRKTVVETEEEARSVRLVSSPTVRVDGRDIVFETRESRCDTCSDLCGCAGGTTCRVWSYQGEEHTEAPVGLVVEALLREIVGGVPASEEPAAAYELPENLQRFFAGRAAKSEPGAAECCDAGERDGCCEPAAKDACCGASVAA